MPRIKLAWNTRKLKFPALDLIFTSTAAHDLGELRISSWHGFDSVVYIWALI